MTPQEFKQIRLDAGMTQEQLAEAIGVTVTSVSRYENGKHDIIKPVQILMGILGDKP